MKQTCSDQLTDELVTATEKTTTNQLERSDQLRTRATQTAASIEPNHMTGCDRFRTIFEPYLTFTLCLQLVGMSDPLFREVFV